MVYLRPYPTIGVFRHGLRLCLAVGLLCHGLSGALFHSWECFVMVYLRLYLTVGVFCHFVMVYRRLYLTVGMLYHSLYEAVSVSRSALSWSI